MISFLDETVTEMITTLNEAGPDAAAQQIRDPEGLVPADGNVKGISFIERVDVIKEMLGNINNKLTMIESVEESIGINHQYSLGQLKVVNENIQKYLS